VGRVRETHQTAYLITLPVGLRGLDPPYMRMAEFDWQFVVIGGGAAGLLAAARAAERGKRTLLLEKNRKPGVKILMSGGTRCNLTHDTDAAGIIGQFGRPGRFLHSALAKLSPRDLVNLFEAEGVPTKVEPTGKIFPVSNKATDVLAALLGRLARSGATMVLGEPVTRIERAGEGFDVHTAARVVSAEKVLITTGGQSYPGCGTTGDGYAWAAALGHTIVPPRPALVPLVSEEAWVRELTGVTLTDVEVYVIDPAIDDSRRACLARRRGSHLFTHFGLSGPAPMDVSRAVTEHPRPHTLVLRCDLLPDTNEAMLDDQLHRAAQDAGKRQIVNIVPEAIPDRLAEAVVAQAGLQGSLRAAELSRTDRGRLARTIKSLDIPLSGTRGFAKAEVTAGGVSLDEVDSRTMQSKLVPNLYLAGEILDLDGPIGGYNFQSAFSTGYLAAESC
jgi:predicted Rossmann fold flavoprotein